jgi:molecular chaperone GrpE
VKKRGNGHQDDAEGAAKDAARTTATEEEERSEGGLEPRAADAPAEPGAGQDEDELARLRRECSELKDALLRRRADFENFRKRVERDRSAATTEAEAAVLRQVLSTVDNLERALAAQDSGKALREGVMLTHRELLSMLESLGVVAIDALGERFDPSAHQAILHEPSPGFEPGTVSEVYRKGFRYRDRLLRPAMVKVASGPDETSGGGDVQ